MARTRKRKQFDRVSDYVEEQVRQLSQNYRRYRLVFLGIFAFIWAANIAVAALALTVMAKVIDSNRFDSLGIVALTAASTAIINLILVAVNAALRYSYKKNQYAEASRTIQNSYVAYLYGIGRYENDGFETFKQDVNNIVNKLNTHSNWFRSLVRHVYDLDE